MAVPGGPESAGVFAAKTGHFVLGMQGLALLRMWLTGDAALIRERLHELRMTAALLDEPPLSDTFEVPELGSEAGYDVWAATYDDQATTNRAIVREEKAVLPLLDAAPVGRALDAACGTGRHTRHLVARGHDVIGVDASPAMLERARAALAGQGSEASGGGRGRAEFRVGRLEALPVEDASVDLAVCGLALTHCPELAAPVRELARVVRPDGWVIISDIHPFGVLLSTGHAVFRGSDGGSVFVRNHVHLHGEYLKAFAGTGLSVVRCIELCVGPEEARPGPIQRTMQQAAVGLPATLVWVLRRE